MSKATVVAAALLGLATACALAGYPIIAAAIALYAVFLLVIQ